jgi:hypothetical protein
MPTRNTSPSPTDAPTSGELSLTFADELTHGYFVVIASALFRCPDLSPEAKALYGLLCTYAYEGCPERPKQADLAASLSIPEKAVRRALRELVDVGLASMTRGGDGKPATYHVRTWEGKKAAAAGRTDENGRSASRSEVPKTAGLNRAERPKSTAHKDSSKADAYASAAARPPVAAAAAVDSPDRSAEETWTPAPAPVTGTTVPEPPPAPPPPPSAPAPDASAPDAAPPPAGTPVPLLRDMAAEEVEALAKRNPADLLRRFRREVCPDHPGLAATLAAKEKQAERSPALYVRDWIAETLTALRDADERERQRLAAGPPAAPPRPATPKNDAIARRLSQRAGLGDGTTQRPPGETGQIGQHGTDVPAAGGVPHRQEMKTA